MIFQGLKSSALLRSNLLHSERLRRAVPASIKAMTKRRIPYADYRVEQLRREAESRLGGRVPIESDYDSPYGVHVGIFLDSSYTFAFHVAACRDLGVRFKVIDLLASDWCRRVIEAGCDAFLASPPTLRSLWRRAYEERLWVVAHDLGKRLCPAFEELYLWESKRRMRDWLVAHDVPHPETWVFFDRGKAMEFCRNTNYPVVCKTDSGAASSGIAVLRDRRSAERIVAQAFGHGILARSSDRLEPERGGILFQRFVAHDFEWRIVRIGDDFLCRRKVRDGDFASGSGEIGWAEPLPGMLDFVWEITELGGFRSMAVDLFENPSPLHGRPFLVNELQAIFGAIEDERKVNAHTGRWRIDHNAWSFEPGFFYHNACANLRVMWLLRTIGQAPVGDVEHHGEAELGHVRHLRHT